MNGCSMVSNDKRRWAALGINNFPLITNARAFNLCLDGLVISETKYESRDILTNRDEKR